MSDPAIAEIAAIGRIVVKIMIANDRHQAGDPAAMAVAAATVMMQHGVRS